MSLKPPVAEKRPHELTCHGDTRIDEYYWLQEKEDAEVRKYLEAENQFLEESLADVKELREELFQELKSRVVEEEESVPYLKGDFLYSQKYQKGLQYPIYQRARCDDPSLVEVLLNPNKIDSGYFNLGNFKVSPDQKLLAYSIDLDGGESYELRVKEIATGEEWVSGIKETYYGLAWSSDSSQVFYVGLNPQLRPDKIWAVDVKKPEPRLVYSEADPEFFASVYNSRSGEYIFIETGGAITSEILFLESSNPAGAPKPVLPREKGVLYSVAHRHEEFYVLSNKSAENFKVFTVDRKTLDYKRTVIEHSEAHFIEDIDAFSDFLVVNFREDGGEKIRLVESDDDHVLEFPEPICSVGLLQNPEFDSHSLRLRYSSPVTPRTVFDYAIRDQRFETRKVQEVPGGYEKEQYKTWRDFAVSEDGAKVPLTLVSRADLDESAPRKTYLYGYGSYGYSIPVHFSKNHLSLLDRGFVVCFAHIRGGSEMGRRWYLDGKYLKKKNTFLDFAASAKHLIAQGITSPSHLCCVGGSAGGMLVGATINMFPELFKAAVAHVPFLDVLTTMLNDQLPLTTIEYEEWGNPNNKEYYEYMKSYSPYDNIRETNYPDVLATAGFNDPRVTYWEPAKWVARLRERRTDNGKTLMWTHLGAGHGGSSGRYESLRDTALEFAFLIKCLP